MKAEIVAIGSELLLGQSTDTNSVWLSNELASMGIDCYFHTSVGDNKDRMAEVFRSACDRSDYVFCTGGLGPTQDDITRAALAQVMGVELLHDVSVEAMIRAKFAHRQTEMPQNNLLQAQVPAGAKTMDAMPGTAPGLICELPNNTVVYAMPGVPFEMKEMFADSVVEDLLARSGEQQLIGSRVIRTWGQSESKLAEVLDPLVAELDQNSGSFRATLAFLASGVEGLKVRITVKADSDKNLRERLDELEQRVRKELGDTVFGVDEASMESVVLELLEKAGLSLAVAESVTGGYLAGRICSVPGASRSFLGGVVAYEQSIKREILGVSSGVGVSEQTAIEMADGVRTALGASVGLATTGVAGPAELEGNPVGTVWIGIAIEDDSFAKRVTWSKNREQIRNLSTLSALDELRKVLLSKT